MIGQVERWSVILTDQAKDVRLSTDITLCEIVISSLTLMIFVYSTYTYKTLYTYMTTIRRETLAGEKLHKSCKILVLVK